jgi:hypothetical protein
MARRREFSIFSLSLLDCICCGFGAMVLFHMIVSATSRERKAEAVEDVSGQVAARETEVQEAEQRLAAIRNAQRRSSSERVRMEGLSSELLEEITKLREELATYENQNLAKKTSLEKLKSDLRSLEEGNKRLAGGIQSQETPGRSRRVVAGDGDRQYLSGLKVGGRRILFLVDASASMLADDIVNAVRRQYLPEAQRLRARKWQQALRSVDWLVSQMPRGADFQIYAFDTRARASVAGTDGTWLKGSDGVAIEKAVEGLRRTAPLGGTSLHAAFAVVGAMNPRPDNVILLTDGLPTQGTGQPRSRTVSGKERVRLFESARELLPRGVPVNVVLFPLEGDPSASGSFWKLAMTTRGSLMTPSRDWP